MELEAPSTLCAASSGVLDPKLRNKLPLKGLIPRVVEVVKEYADSRKLGDDICLLGFALNPLAADRQ